MSQTRRLRLPAAERVQQLLDTAEGLFTEYGYDGVSVDDVARAAGVTRPVVYHHFSSKDDIFLACAVRAGKAFEERINDGLAEAGDSIEDRIVAGGRPYFDMVEQDPRRWALLFTTSANLSGGTLADRLSELHRAHVEHIAAWARPYAGSLGEDDVMVFAYAVSGIGEQLGRWWLRNPHITKEQVLAYYRVLVGGAVQGMRSIQGGDAQS